MSKDIKRCSHCGSFNCRAFLDDKENLGIVVCSKCSACIVGKDIEEAITKWNKRFIEIQIKQDSQ